MRLRASLSAALAILMVVGVMTSTSNARVSAALDQVVVTKSPTAEPVATHTATTTAEQQILDKLSARQFKRGCGIALVPATPKRKVGTCTVLLVGDSMGNNLGSGLAYQLERTKGIDFLKRSKGSTGLSNSWFYDWPAELKPMLSRYKPNLVIMMLGANDRQNMKVGTRVLTYPTTAWQSAYKSQVTKMTKLATDAGAYVLWVGMPISKPYNYNEGMKVINAQFRAVVPTMSGATFVPLWTLTADSAGAYRQYASVNGVRTKIRGDDGIHFTADGQSVIGTYIIDKVASVYHVTLRSTHRHELR